MKVDRDNPHTWVKYKDSHCRDCLGTCCTMPVEVKLEDLVRLGFASEDDASETRRKVVNRLKKEGVVESYRAGTDLFTLSRRPNGDCFLLDEKTRLCREYANRPNVCRAFPRTMGNRLGFCPVLPKS